MDETITFGTMELSGALNRDDAPKRPVVSSTSATHTAARHCHNAHACCCCCCACVRSLPSNALITSTTPRAYGHTTAHTRLALMRITRAQPPVCRPPRAFFVVYTTTPIRLSLQQLCDRSTRLSCVAQLSVDRNGLTTALCSFVLLTLLVRGVAVRRMGHKWGWAG
jgi:hypothetical protein